MVFGSRLKASISRRSDWPNWRRKWPKGKGSGISEARMKEGGSDFQRGSVSFVAPSSPASGLMAFISELASSLFCLACNAASRCTSFSSPRALAAARSFCCSARRRLNSRFRVCSARSMRACAMSSSAVMVVNFRKRCGSSTPSRRNVVLRSSISFASMTRCESQICSADSRRSCGPSSANAAAGSGASRTLSL